MLLSEDMPIKEFDENLDKLTDEQLDSMIEGNEVEIKDEPEEKIDDKPKAEADEPEKDEPEADASQKKPEEEPEKDEPKMVIIDDEYIKNADEKDRAVLESIKGETLSDKMLKKHVSAEHGIDRFKGEKGEAVSKLESLKRDFETQKETTPVTPEKQTQIDEVVLKRLKDKYSDFPDTEEGMNELGYENQKKAFDYMQAEREERANVQKQVKEVQYYQENASEINTEVLNNDISLIKAEMDKVGITEEDLGVSFEFDEEGDFKDKRLDNLFYADGKKGEYDRSLIGTKYGIGIMKENAFAMKFQREFTGDFYKAIHNKALVEGAKGTKEAESITKAMSNGKPGTQQQFENDEAKIDAMTPEQLDAEIERLS